jgi:hypothetical protein
MKNCKRVQHLLLTFVFTGLFFTGCYYDNEEELYPGSVDCDVTNVDYSTVIKPIADSNCAISGCHVPGTGLPDLTTYVGLKTIADNGKLNDRVVVRKDMPPSGPLSNCDIDKIEAWISQGAPEN